MRVRRFLQLALLLTLLALLTLSVPALSQLYPNRDDIGFGTPGWQSYCIGPPCAGGVGTPSYVNQTFTNTSLSLDGNSMMMTETGTNYSNVMFHYSFGANNGATTFTGTYSAYIQSSLAPWQVFGMDMYQFIPGVRLMFGSQCAISGATAGYWSFFDQGDNPPNGTWKVSSVACPIVAPNTWYTISMTVHRVPGDTSCSGGVPAEHYDSITINGTTTSLGLSYCSETYGGSNDTGMQFDVSSSAAGGTLTAYVDEMSYFSYIPPSSTSPYNVITSPIIPDVLTAPSLGGITGNNALVTDAMVASNTIYRVTDGATQTGANSSFEYSVPCGGSADNNIISLGDHFFLTVDSGSNYFIRYLNPSGHNSLALYPNLDPAKGNLTVNCGEFSYTNDLLYYDYGSIALSAPAIVNQYNLTGYNVPSITTPAAVPTQTQMFNYANAGVTGVQWRTAGGINRSDNLNSLSFVNAMGFSLTGSQGTGCIVAAGVANAVNPVATNNLYYVYNTCTGVVTKYSYTGGWNATILGTVSNVDRYCVHNVKYHGGSWVTVTATFAGCSGAVTGSGAVYYFWNYTTSTVIPCVACTGHETEYINSFIGAESSSNDGYNFQQITYSTAGAGLVNTSGTTMTFVSGIPPSASMTGEIAINNVAYQISSCTSSTCTLTTSVPTLTGVYYNYPVTALQDAGTYGSPKLITYPSLWSQVDPCSAGSFPFANSPCYKTPLDTHLSANTNPGNDTGMVFYTTTSFSNTQFPRSIGTVSVTGGTVTLTYGAPFTSSWVGHNIIINRNNCTISPPFISTSQMTVTGCSLGTLTNVPYLFTLYSGGSYDEVNGIVGGGTTPPAGYNYRFGYMYNTTLSPYFSTQNAIGAASQDGTVILFSSDWQCTLGTTNGTSSTYCPPDWYASGSLASGALLWPRTNNGGLYVYTNSSACTLSSLGPNPWNQTVGGTQSNGGCTLTNIGTIRGDIFAMNTGASAPSTQTLTVTVAGSGTVTDNLAEISCPSTCTASYTSGTVVTLSQSPTAGYTFTGWTGACSGIGACVVTMSSAQGVTATFILTPPAPSGLEIQNGVQFVQGVTLKP